MAVVRIVLHGNMSILVTRRNVSSAIPQAMVGAALIAQRRSIVTAAAATSVAGVGLRQLAEVVRTAQPGITKNRIMALEVSAKLYTKVVAGLLSGVQH